MCVPPSLVSPVKLSSLSSLYMCSLWVSVLICWLTVCQAFSLCFSGPHLFFWTFWPFPASPSSMFCVIYFWTSHTLPPVTYEVWPFKSTCNCAKFKWRILEEPAMEGCMLDQIWEEEWRTGLDVPPNSPLTGSAYQDDMLPVMVGDASFPVKPHLIRLYPGQNLTHQKRIFNHRLRKPKCL